MFERYNEKARRVIFFARYEASQFGSSQIETGHLLLGLLKENGRLLVSRFPSDDDILAFRDHVASGMARKQPVTTSVDLPLSNENKRVLAYAAEEATRLNHGHIGPEHILLGLLREKSSAAILNESGISLEAMRKVAHDYDPLSQERSARASGTFTPFPRQQLVFMEGNTILADDQIQLLTVVPRSGESVVLGEKHYRVTDVTYEYTNASQSTRIIVSLAAKQ